MKKFLTLAVALFAVICVQAQEITKTFTDITAIRMNTASGSCKVVKGNGQDVQVKLVYTYSNDKFKPVMEKDGHTLILKEEFEHGSNSGNSTWTLTVPDNLELNFNTGSGDLDIRSLAIMVKSNTGSGNISLQTINGNVKINTGSGTIEMENITGNVDGNAGSGTIEVSSTKGDIALNAGSGNIRITGITGKVSANVGSGNIKAGQLVLTGKGSFNSGSGNVAVTLAASPDYSIAVNSGSGDAQLNFNGNKIEGTVIMTANKRNGEIFAPFKFDKVEELDDDGDNVRIRKTAKLSDKDIQIKVSTGSGKATIEK